MKKDMELVRKILLTIEDKYVDCVIYNLKIDGYEPETISYHCALLYDAGFISDYKSQNADGRLWTFVVGRLTWEGHEFLDKIRNETIWNKTKETMIKNGLPMVLDVIKSVASTIISSMAEGAIKAIQQS